MATKKKLEVLLGGIGAAPKQGELVRVGVGAGTVTVETGALRKLAVEKKASAAEGDEAPAADAKTIAESLVELESGGGAGAGQKVPAAVVRIALTLKILELLKGGTKVRPSLVKDVETLLNQGAAPAVHASRGAFAPFVDRLGKVATNGALTEAEKAILLGDRTLAHAYAVICTEASRQLLSLSTGVASLSCEAAGADMRFLDQAALENHGNKHVTAAGMELRGVLDGSPVLSSSKGKRADCFSELPFAHAIAAQTLGELSKAVNIEVACPQASFVAGKSDAMAVASSSIESLLLSTVEAMLSVVALSLERTQEVLAALAATPGGHAAAGLAAFVQGRHDAAKSLHANAASEALAFAEAMLKGRRDDKPFAAGLAAASVTDALHQSLLVESLAAVALLRIKQGAKVAEEEKKSDAAQEEAAAAAAADGKKQKKQKKKKEKKKKGGVGKGSEMVQKYLEDACMAGEEGCYLNALCPAAEGAEAAPSAASLDVDAVYRNLSKSIDWGLTDLNKFLASLRQVIEANQPRRKPIIAKGTRDFLPDQMKIREGVFSKVVSVFKKHGAVSIDTPVFELRETLMGKYGEDSKLIYDLADQGGQILSLRYDLTVPFSRYCALNNCGNIKRYHVGKVYRRDQPQMNRGRFREFFQCDFDIAGTYSSMVPDSEVIKVMVEILSDLEIGDFQIKINHRLLLDSIMAVCGVPEQKFRPICSAIDKLDKSPWEEVRREMVEDKGLAPEAADRIGQIVGYHGHPKEMLETLRNDPNEVLAALRMHPKAKTALDELALLFDFLEAMNALDKLSLDMSLARGLDYYTGVIYEAVLVGGNVGSIAAGGRYDYLVGSFAGKDIPAVGVSIGIERVYAIIEAKLKEQAKQTGVPIRSTDTQVLVSSIGNGMQKKRMEIANLLWSSGICAEFGFKPNPKMGDQINYALENGIPFMVLFGEDEIVDNKVKIKDMKERTEITVSLDDLVAELKKLTTQ